ncbi:MAG: hypothetical protein K8S55_08010 [Phycisphaerae bacterium]|nr:hypothetical protein [Phycisphaerae bacterium]
MKKYYMSFLLFLLGGILSSCTPPAPVHNIPKAAFQADADELKGTIVTSHLEQKIPKDKNVLWCATFQLAWNELMDLAGGPLRMPNQPSMVDVLNQRKVSGNDVNSENVVVMAGLVADGVLEKTRKDIERKFHGQGVPELLPASNMLPPDAVVMYAFLLNQLPFRVTFKRLYAMPFRSYSAMKDREGTKPPEVACFGIYQYLLHDKRESKQASQVRILWHKFAITEDRINAYFAVELLTASKEDRLILAKLSPEKTLAATITKVQHLIAKPNTALPDKSLDMGKLLSMPRETLSKYASLLPLENLTVPVLDFDIIKEFRKIYDKPVIAKNPKVNGLPFKFAKQQIRFKLDETGAVLKSEATGALLCGPPRDFSFDEPFLILLMRKGASQPYFALWVGNTELLVPASPAK